MIQILLCHRIPEKSKGSDNTISSLQLVVQFVFGAGKHSKICKNHIFLTYTYEMNSFEMSSSLDHIVVYRVNIWNDILLTRKERQMLVLMR